MKKAIAKKSELISERTDKADVPRKAASMEPADSSEATDSETTGGGASLPPTAPRSEASSSGKVDLKAQLETGMFSLKSLTGESKKPMTQDMVSKSEKVLKSLKSMGSEPTQGSTSGSEAKEQSEDIEGSGISAAEPDAKHDAYGATAKESQTLSGVDDAKNSDAPEPSLTAKESEPSVSTSPASVEVQTETGMFKLNQPTLEQKTVAKVDMSIQERLMNAIAAKKAAPKPELLKPDTVSSEVIKPTRKATEHIQAKVSQEEKEISFAPQSEEKKSDDDTTPGADKDASLVKSTDIDVLSEAKVAITNDKPAQAKVESSEERETKNETPVAAPPSTEKPASSAGKKSHSALPPVPDEIIETKMSVRPLSSSHTGVPSSPPSQFGNLKSGYETIKIQQGDLTKGAAAKSSLNNLDQIKTPEPAASQLDSNAVAKARFELSELDSIGTPKAKVGDSNKTTTPKIDLGALDKIAAPKVNLGDLGLTPTMKTSDTDKSPIVLGGPTAADASAKAQSGYQASRGGAGASLRGKVAGQSSRQNKILIGATSLLLLCCVGWFAWSFQQKSSLLNDLESQFNSKKYSDAQQTVDQGLKLYPNDPIFLYYNSRLLVMRGMNEQALPEMRKALEAQPNRADMLFERAKIYFALGKDSDSIQDTTRIIDSKQADGAAYALRGESEMRLNKTKEAIADFEAAIKLEPKKADLHSDYAQALFDMQKYKQSIQNWNTVVAMEPTNAEALAQRAMSEYKAGEVAKADTDFAKSIDIRPTGIVYFLKGLVEADHKHFAEASSDFKESLNLDSDNLAVANAKKQVESGSLNIDKALAAFSVLESAKGPAESPEALKIKAEAAMTAEQYGAAEQAYTKLLEVSPNDASYRLKRAIAAELGSHHNLAEKDYESLIAAEPNNLDYIVRRGALSTREKQYTIASNYFEKAIHLNPGFADAYLKRGLNSLAQNNTESARSDFEQVLKIQPNNGEAKRKLTQLPVVHVATPRRLAEAPQATRIALTGDAQKDGYNLMQAGDVEGAIAQLYKAIKKDKNNSTSRRYMAYCLMENNQFAEAD